MEHREAEETTKDLGPTDGASGTELADTAPQDSGKEEVVTQVFVLDDDADSEDASDDDFGEGDGFDADDDFEEDDDLDGDDDFEEEDDLDGDDDFEEEDDLDGDDDPHEGLDFDEEDHFERDDGEDDDDPHELS